MINPLSKVEMTHYVLHHPRVPEAAQGFRIAQLSDIHLGRWVKPRHLAQLVEHVNDYGPDVNALTGDYVGYNKHDIDRCVPVLAGLEAPTFAVLGNHDHWTDGPRAIAAFEATDIDLLSNERRTFALRGGGAIDIVGVDDHVTGHADVPRAFKDVDRERFCLTLNHVPAIAPECAAHGAHLILSGHTHNFQFNIPRLTNRLARTFGTRYFAGPYRLHDAILYINRGLGSASWPWRLRAMPEVTFITLRYGRHPILELASSELHSVAHRP